MAARSSHPDILARLRRVEAKDWAELSEVLDEAGGEDICALKPEIPKLLVHRNWVVRASAVELVGEFKLREFLDQIVARLDDRNAHVKSYALMAYFDLLGRAAVPLIRTHCEGGPVSVRAAALVLCYVATKENAYLGSLERIVLRKNCDYHHRYAVFHIFDYYLDITADPEVRAIFEAIVRIAPPWHGVSRDIARRLETGCRG